MTETVSFTGSSRPKHAPVTTPPRQPAHVPAAAAPAAELHGITKVYDGVAVLNDLSLTVEQGEIVALIGKSGSGKSTTLRVLAGLSDDHSGTYRTDGPPAIAFQEPRLFPWRSVHRNVVYGLNRVAVGGAEADRRALEALREVGLEEKRDAWPMTLSGGQAQRVSLARALVADPRLLLLDEPFGALDALTRRSMHALLLRLFDSHGFGVLLVTHDVDEAVALADRVVVLADGRIASDTAIAAPRPRERTDSALAATSRQLLAALGVETD